MDFFKLLVMTYEVYRKQPIFFQNMQLLLSEIIIQIMNIRFFEMNLAKKFTIQKVLNSYSLNI